MKQTTANTSSFEGLLDDYLKAENIENFPAKVFVTFCTIEELDSKARVIYDVQYDGKKYKWSCNKTNLRILKKKGLEGPKNLCDKHVTFGKIRVRNPSTGENMDSLEVVEIE